jgi:hypothetical protein
VALTAHSATIGLARTRTTITQRWGELEGRRYPREGFGALLKAEWPTGLRCKTPSRVRYSTTPTPLIYPPTPLHTGGRVQWFVAAG